MQFDVIIGNPPYQLRDGGHGQSAAPIYQLFVEKALELAPRFAVFVTPSRWMAGGKGLQNYRERMLADRRLKSVVDFPKLYEGFPGVKVRGGISYFLWDREHDGKCNMQTIWDGEPTGPAVARFLDEFDVLVRRNEAVPILQKVLAKGEPTLAARVSARKPFGLPTFFHGMPSPTGLADRSGSSAPKGDLGRAGIAKCKRRLDGPLESAHDRFAGHQCSGGDQVLEQTDNCRSRHRLHRDVFGLPGTSTRKGKPRTTPSTSAPGLSASSFLSERQLSTQLGTSTARGTADHRSLDGCQTLQAVWAVRRRNCVH